MGLPRRMLADGEHIELVVRTHVKTLAPAALLLIILGAATGVALGAVPADYRPAATYGVLGLAVVLMLWWCLIPYLRWRATIYVLTNRRLITRSGLVSKTGKDLPLAWITDVTHRRSLSDRILGCGTLYLQPVAQGDLIVLVDVPDVEAVHRRIGEQLFAVHHRGDPDRNRMVRDS